MSRARSLHSSALRSVYTLDGISIDISNARDTTSIRPGTLPSLQSRNPVYTVSVSERLSRRSGTSKTTVPFFPPAILIHLPSLISFPVPATMQIPWDSPSFLPPNSLVISFLRSNTASELTTPRTGPRAVSFPADAAEGALV